MTKRMTRRVQSNQLNAGANIYAISRAQSDINIGNFICSILMRVQGSTGRCDNRLVTADMIMMLMCVNHAADIPTQLFGTFQNQLMV